MAEAEDTLAHKPMKKEIKKVRIVEDLSVPSVEQKPTEEEVELAELIALRDGLVKRNIDINSRLGVLIDELQRRLQSH